MTAEPTPTAEPNPVPDKFVWVRAAAAVLASVAAASIPIVAVLITSQYAAITKNSERDTQFIEMAIGILSDKPTDENRVLRSWAVRVIRHRSDPELRFTEEEERLLIEDLQLVMTNPRNRLLEEPIDPKKREFMYP